MLPGSWLCRVYCMHTTLSLPARARLCKLDASTSEPLSLSDIKLFAATERRKHERREVLALGFSHCCMQKKGSQGGGNITVPCTDNCVKTQNPLPVGCHFGSEGTDICHGLGCGSTHGSWLPHPRGKKGAKKLIDSSLV